MSDVKDKTPRARPPEPDFVAAWRSSQRAPKCCHTCEHYGVDGLCVTFFMTPPVEFAATVDSCPDWQEECPF